MEATGNALAIARILEPHVAEVVLAHAKQVRAISHARVKTDKIDAKVLADLLAAGLIPAVWIGDERCADAAAAGLAAPRAGQAPHADQERDLARCCIATSRAAVPASDPFGAKGRAWIAEQQLPIDERLTVDAGLRQLDFLGDELAQIDRVIAQQVLGDEDVRRLMTIPGIDVVTAARWSAVIGDIRRFPTVAPPGRLPRAAPDDPPVGQRARPATAALSKEGSAAARHVLVEAAWSAAKSPGPLRAFAQRTAARRGRHVATVAVARKLAVLAWHLLTRGEDYAFQRPSLVRRKLRAHGAQRRRAARQARPERRPGLEHHQRRRREAPRAAGRDRLPTLGRRLAGHAARRRVRARHRSAHLKGPRRARPRGRPQAPDACTSPRQSPAPNRQRPTRSPNAPASLTFIRRSSALALAQWRSISAA